MSETDKQAELNFTLSEAHSDRVVHFETAVAAGRAFADANAYMRPHVSERIGNSARTVARTIVIADKIHKSVPTLDDVRSDPVNIGADGKPKDGMGKTNVAFWTAFHAREEEKVQEVAKEAKPGETEEEAKPPKMPLPITSLAMDPVSEGSAEATTTQPAKTPDERFSMPASFQDRFILTKEADRQELFRSYDDKRPAISDRGESLHTKSADRSTAMDMIELAAHRGWSSMKVRGPEEFRREMWIEGTAQGIRVQGYRPNEKDRVEAERRAGMIGERIIERTDHHHQRTGIMAQQQDQPPSPTNVVPMIDYKKGIEGKITGIGTAPYRDRDGAAKTPFVALDLPDGRSHKLWGVALPDMVDRNQLKVGDKATIHDAGKKAVTVQERDPGTGEVSEKQTFRREWGARNIERGPEREGNQVAPAQQSNEVVIDAAAHQDQGKQTSAFSANPSDHPESPRQSHQAHPPDRLEERLLQKEAARDPLLRGAASTIARLEAEMLAADIPDKDRAKVRALASSELAQGLRAGRTYDVQRLPNISRSQVMAAKSLNPKSISKIIEQARVHTVSNILPPSDNGGSHRDPARERAANQDKARDR
ncbi:LPD7 domain-containing protein [Roseobacter litoralis]|uniref:LPD7 domain-containing protein n=1 Tax=Roseobacter litoralis TaxID=42443 RepID=UPI002494F49A|nr:LPD7 domain-containing protein [Roseobacter litoralis]